LTHRGLFALLTISASRPMLVNLPFLLLALVLLCFPRQWMRLGLTFMNRKRRRSEGATRREEEPWKNSEPGDPAVGFREEFLKVRNYVDLFRATAGSLAVFGGLGIDPCVSAPPDAHGLVLGEVFAVQCAILLVGLLIQSVRHERGRFLVFAPIFFLAGLSVGVCGVKAAGFAFALIWAVNPMLKNPSAFLTAYALLIGLFGGLFLEFTDKLVILGLFLTFLPVLLSALMQRPLVLFTRKSVRAAKS
jgi:hypothetical protein